MTETPPVTGGEMPEWVVDQITTAAQHKGHEFFEGSLLGAVAWLADRNAQLEQERREYELFRDNIFMLAHRMRRNRTPENVAHCIAHTIRLCDECGAKANILRGTQGNPGQIPFVDGEGHWVGSHKYTEMQLAHIRACEPHRWRVDDNCLGYVWEPFDRPSPSRPAGGEV